MVLLIASAPPLAHMPPGLKFMRRPSFPTLKRYESEQLSAQLPPVVIAIDNLTELTDELTGRKYTIEKDNTIIIRLQSYEFLWLNLRENVFKY